MELYRVWERCQVSKEGRGGNASGGGGGKSAGSRDRTGSGSGQCLSLISFELVRGLTAVVYCRHTGGKASSPHKWGKAGYADHLGRLSVTRANRVQLDSLHAGEWVRVGCAARYGVLVGWLRGLRAVQASGWSCRGWSVGLVCGCALYSSTKLDVIVVAS